MEWEPGLELKHHKRRCPRCSSFNIILDQRLGMLHCTECGFEGRDQAA